MNPPVDPSLDLVLERTVPVPPELVYKAWTTPELLTQWFTPKPWITPHVEVDLRPGGIFRTVMRGPEGEEFDGKGCYLEVVPNEKLVWTSALLPEYRPAALAPGAFPFTATLRFEAVEGGTRYRAHVAHADVESCQKHMAMGFQEGWGQALTQLVELMSK
jgi:uncharacterized protein YndB with AHSA1/START domain